MADKLVAPSMPKSSSKEKIEDIAIPDSSNKDIKKNKKLLFNNILKKKDKNQPNEQQITIPEIEMPKPEIPKNTVLDKIKNNNEPNGHVLDQINKIEEDIQIPKINNPAPIEKPKLDNTRHSTLDSIEEVYFNNDSKEEVINQENIKQIKKALGIGKDKTEKIIKIDEFKKGLFDDSDKDQDIVTNLKLEEKLQPDIGVSPSEEVKHIKTEITMDTECAENSSFMLSDGRKLKSLRDLRNALENISNSVFSNHVNAIKNDFSKWVENTFNEPKLANILRKCRQKEILLSVLVTIEKIEIEELIMLRERDILDKHNNTLKDLTFVNKEREEINKEKELLEKEEDTIDDLRETLEKKLEELKQKQVMFAKEIAKTKIDKISLDKEKELVEKEEEDFKSNIDREYELKKQEVEKAREDYLKVIKEQNQEFDNLRKDLFEQTQKYKERLESDYKGKIKALDGRKSELNKQKKEINSLYELKIKQLKKEQKELYELKKHIEQQKVELQEKENEAKKHISKLSEKLSEAQIKDNKIDNKIEINKNILAEIRQREVILKNMEKEIEHGAFQKYLNTELQKLLGPEEDLPIEKQVNEKEIAETYANIEKCQKLVQHKKIKEAKAAYNQIRKDFYSAEIPEQEKDILKNILRNLYTDIHMQEI